MSYALFVTITALLCLVLLVVGNLAAIEGIAGMHTLSAIAASAFLAIGDLYAGALIIGSAVVAWTDE